jgi:hypothetical protein
MADDDTTTGSTEEAAQSSTEAGSEAADPQKVIDDLRKRQSGADKARDTAIAERDELARRLEALTSGKASTGNESTTKDEAAIRAEVSKEFEQRLANERAADLAKVLDATFPVARKKFPGITDAAQLAELETVFGEDKTPAPPKPIGNNPASAGKGAKNIEDMSVKELREQLDREAQGLLNPQS